jgi:hypothetical protein
MFTHSRWFRGIVTAAVVLLAAVVAACGNQETAAGAASGADDADTTAASADVANGDWLLKFNTAGGADGESARAVYVRFNPATGAASSRVMPAVTATDVYVDQQALLVSADHRRVLLDTGIPTGDSRSGKLVVYSVSSTATETVDIRALTGAPKLRAMAWAFDPDEANVLRVVDYDRFVWKVDLAAGSATKESELPTRSGWIFGNGFDKNTGEPYIEDIDSDETLPPGNGDTDVRPVERQGGTLIPYDGTDLADLPKPPCGFAGGFQLADGTTWLFCADTPSISAYRLRKGGNTWIQFGKASPEIVPRVATDLALALPPVA